MTQQHDKELAKEFTVNQTETAEILDVDRATVARWCRQGLPCVKKSLGNEHLIELKTAIHWVIGHRWATENNVDLSSIEKILFALAWGSAAGNENVLFSHWQRRAMLEGDWLCASREEVSFAAGFLYGAELLPWLRAELHPSETSFTCHYTYCTIHSV